MWEKMTFREVRESGKQKIGVAQKPWKRKPEASGEEGMTGKHRKKRNGEVLHMRDTNLDTHLGYLGFGELTLRNSEFVFAEKMLRTHNSVAATVLRTSNPLKGIQRDFRGLPKMLNHVQGCVRHPSNQFTC